MTVSGTPVSLEAGGSGAVVGPSTEALGSKIIGAFGTGGPETFTGDAPGVVAQWWSWRSVVLGVVGLRLALF